MRTVIVFEELSSSFHTRSWIYPRGVSGISRSERLAHLPAVQAGEHQVQDDGGIRALSGQRQRLNAVARPIDGVARLFPAVADPAGDGRFIFDE
jgi:hypothetical protein